MKIFNSVVGSVCSVKNRSLVHSLTNGPIPNPKATVLKCAKDEGEGADSVNPKSESSIRGF